LNQQSEEACVSNDLSLDKLKELFTNNDSFVVRKLMNNQSVAVASMVYLDILIDEKGLNQYIIPQIVGALPASADKSDKSLIDTLENLAANKVLHQLDHAVNWIMNAGIIIILPGCTKAYGIQLPGYETRSIDEPKIEINVRGPKESFVEDLHQNLSMVYRKLRTPDLKSESYIIGKQSETKMMLLYLESRVDPKTLELLKKKVEKIQLDLLVANIQIEELIQDNTYSPFPQILDTERPDRVVSLLNRGKIAIVTDGTPIVLAVPSTFFEIMHPSDDLYERFYFANFLRIIRLVCLFVSLFGPSTYIALTTFHLEMIPTPLMMNFISSKANIPFPTFVEAILMETAFEVLREASLRLPRAVGQSVSIVGALIIGEAAVQSGIVSRPMVIVVAMTGIASFAIPSFSTAIAFRLLRFPLILFAAYCGVFGISLCMLLILLHLCSLTSLGKPFLEPVDFQSTKNSLMRYILLPIHYRINRLGAKNDNGAALQHNRGGLSYEQDGEVDEYR
jgi:Bacillus/Clostridium GerA spore germination protein.